MPGGRKGRTGPVEGAKRHPLQTGDVGADALREEDVRRPAHRRAECREHAESVNRIVQAWMYAVSNCCRRWHTKGRRMPSPRRSA